MKLLTSLIFTALLSTFGFSQTVTNLNNSGAGSLRNVVLNSQPGDVIDFAPSLFANGNATLNLDYPIPIVHSLTINGHLSNGDTLIINGQDTSQAFFVDGSSNPGTIALSLNNMSIVNCRKYTNNSLNYNTNGGALMAKDLAKLSLNNLHFRDNKVAGDGMAGALYCRYVDSVLISHSTFVRNHTDSVSLTSSGGWGGAMRVMYGALSMMSSKFEGNYSINRGGALVTVGTSSMVFKNVDFLSNQTGVRSGVSGNKSGGALFFTGTDKLMFMNCNFIGNSTPDDGGAIYISGFNYPNVDSVIIDNCFFDQNSAAEDGGAIFLSNHLLVQKNSTMSSNVALSRGGAIFAQSGRCELIASTLNANDAPQGSALYGAPNEFDIVNSTIVQNSQSANLIYKSNGTEPFTVESSILMTPSGSNLFNSTSAHTSNGHNIFSSSTSIAVASDLVNVSMSSLDLGPLQINRGSTPTRLPGPASLAINGGNPTDFSPAQNGPIFGRRDIGAAERGVISYDTTLICGNITWWGNNYNMPGTYSDTAYNANSVDSIGVLVLYSQDTSIENRNGTLVALEQSQGTSYQWVDCGNGFAPVTGATDSTFLPSANGNYAVVLTNGSCSDTSDCISYNEVGIEELSTKQLLTFYPNPTSGSLTLNSIESFPHYLQVLDLSGRTISTLKVSSNEIQLPTLSKGIYLLKWEFEGGVIQVDRVVVE